MAIFRCKMCGGDLEITEGQSVCTCEYCGTEQTLPRLDSDRKANLYDRANHFRRNNDFDKAMGIYEQILNEDNTDAEAYWSLVLCRYGIEYVEDPSTHKRIPTINRAQYTSIFADENYKAALEHAATAQKIVYEQEAKVIDEIQKGILAISEKEEPFDVFICYKESDENGRRTPDSVLANDLYHQLIQEGFKVFFSRITLEDKLGQEYEPYIFAALNSAKVMVVLGTKPDYFKAVWVKNEWARYLALIRSGEKKMLIPAYKDMDPYDLPEEFSHLQAQDMTKLGFMQDLIRGIKKIIGENQPQTVTKETVVVQQGGGVGNSTALIKRGNMALEDGEWQKADDFFEEVLNQDAECAEAYLGKLLLKYKKSDIPSLIQYYISKYESSETEDLEACEEADARITNAVSQYVVLDYLSDSEIRKQYAFDRTYASELSFRKQQKSQVLSELASEKLLSRAQQYASGEKKNLLDKMMEDITFALDSRIADAQRDDNEQIASIKSSYEMHLNGADAKVKELYNNALERQESTYNFRVSQMNAAKTISDYEKVRDLFKDMHGYKDTNALADKCQAEVDRLKEEAERLDAARRKEAARQAKKKKTVVTIVAAITMIVVVVVYMVVTKVVIPNINYCNAIALMNNGNYKEAIEEFEALDGYKDSTDRINNCNAAIKDEKYNNAVALMDSGKYYAAYALLKSLDGYKDSVEIMNSIKKERPLCGDLDVGDTVPFGNYNGNTEWIVLAKDDVKILIISKYALEMRSYNTEYKSITWEKCTLRSWLNGTYLTSAFSSDEQSRIIEASIENPDNPKYGIAGGNNTMDKVFLLSIDEVNKYFTTDSARQTTLADGTSVWWWLRSPGDTGKFVALVNRNGSVNDIGHYVYSGQGAVRPALWIDISD